MVPVLCKDCESQWLTYVKSKGRMVLVTLETHERHNCPSSKYNIRKRSRIKARAASKSAIKRINDFELISEIQEQVDHANTRLAAHTLKLIVNQKEGEEF